MNKNDQQKTVEKWCKLARKYNLKSLEVCENAVKIELNETLATKRDRKLTKSQLEFLENEREQQVMDEMQILDPEAYEEALAHADTGLKEI